MGDFDHEDLNSLNKRRRHWYITQKTYKKQLIKLNNLRKKKSMSFKQNKNYEQVNRSFTRGK